jgi:hypothetical protein
VRGSYDTLREAIETDGWPTLDESRGKIMILLDNGDPLRATYVAEYPGLQGGVFFVSADPDSDEAGYFQANDPYRTNPTIEELVSRNFLLRTRTDVENVEADLNDGARRDRALASGAQWLSTDYPVPADSGYVVTLPGVPEGSVARCNPVSAPPSCSDAELVE